MSSVIDFQNVSNRDNAALTDNVKDKVKTTKLSTKFQVQADTALLQ